MGKPMGPKSWVTGWQWRERILGFEPSWFTAVMSTGTIMECYVNFPYPITGGPRWLRNIGYCLWILEIVLFILFAVKLTVRYIWKPMLLKKTILEFPSSSYLGAIPISLSTIIVGINSYYDYRTSARWASFVVWWIDLVLTLLVSIGLVTVQTMRTPEQTTADVAGLWVMTTVPLFTLAAAGSSLMPYLSVESTKCANIVLVVSFLCWSYGIALLTYILAIYLFRLLAHKLPGPKLLASSFLPVAALSQAAYAFLQMSIYLASYIKTGYAPTQVSPPPLPPLVLQATAEMIHWTGILICLGLLGQASFWLVQAVAAIFYRFPRSFNIGLWSLVFPLASYANTWAVLSRDLRNDGMRGWAATTTVMATILWLFCALMTTYLGFWKGSLFSAPGLEDWLSEEEMEKDEKRTRRHQVDGTYEIDPPDSQEDLENGHGGSEGQANGHAVTDGDAARRRS